MRRAMRSVPSALLAAAVLLLGACHEDAVPLSPEAKPRLLVVGWDAASFRWIDPLIAQGKLPNLARLIERGVRAPLESTIIPISASAWVTAATGRGAGETGVFSFFEPLPASYELTLVSSRSNKTPPIWRLLTARGVPSVVFGIPLTYPPEPILGTMVCGMLSPRDAEYAWPPEVTAELRARGYDPDIEPWLDEYKMTWQDVLRQLSVRERWLTERLAQDDWRLAWIVFKEVDLWSHRSYGVDFAKNVGPVYEELDRILGKLLATVGDDTNVIVMSDHGFATYESGLNLHEWLIQEGFAVRRKDVKTEPLPEGPLATRTPEEADQRLEELDLAETRAYAFACEGNYASLRLNLVGREPQGIVRIEDADDVLSQIETRLRANPWVVRTFRASELLPGPERAALPDLLFETKPDVMTFAERGAPVSGDYPSPLPDHDLLGIFVGAGPSFERDEKPDEPVRMTDVAPTALYLLRQPVLREMKGRVLAELLRETRPVETVAEAELAPLLPELDPRDAYTPEEIEELQRRLFKLGYGQ